MTPPDHDIPANELDPFFPYADASEAPPDLAPALAAYEERMGFLPNALKLYLHRPHILKQIMRLNNCIMRHPRNELSEEFKYRMSFIISRNHGCRYCCAHHAATLRGRFGSADTDLEGILKLKSSVDEREAMAWEFVDAASRGPEHVNDDMRRRLADHFSPAEIVEIAATLGFWAFYNRIHANLDVPIEEHLLPEAGWADVEVDV
jgi:uncharacterized peroxidase-related enzyme